MQHTSQPGSPQILMIDYAEKGTHIVPILRNQFKIKVNVASAEEEIAKELNDSTNLILIIGQKSGEGAHQTAKQIRSIEQTNGLESIPIITLLSKQAAENAIQFPTAAISNYKIASLSELSLQDIVDQYISTPTSALIKNDSDPEIDTSVIDGLAAMCPPDDLDLVNESIAIFIEQYNEKIALIRTFSHQKQRHLIQETAHFMKTSCYMVGAAKLGDLFTQLESKEFTKQEDFIAYANTLDQHFNKAKELLLGHVKKLTRKS